MQKNFTNEIGIEKHKRLDNQDAATGSQTGKRPSCRLSDTPEYISVPPESVLILHRTEIQNVWSQTVKRGKPNNRNSSR